MAAAVGSSVDPEPIRLKHLLFGSNLTWKLLKAASCPDEKDRERMMHIVQENFTKYQDGQRRALVGENGNVSGMNHLFLRNNPDSFVAEQLRNNLKAKNGDNFNDMAYDIINMIPDADWMEFARNALKVDEPSEETSTLRHSSINKEGKYQMIKKWQRRMLGTGQDASAERLQNLTIDFLMRKGGVGKFGNIVQQNFHGPINAQNFNAYTVNSKGPPVQASA